MLKVVKKTRIYEDIVQQIMGLVATGKLKAGDQLPPERELSETFHVSRASVREAIRALESMGLLESRPGDGTYISALKVEVIIQPLAALILHEKDGLLELLEARRVIEPHLAYLAAKKATPEDIERLENILAEQEVRIAEGGTAVEADTAFHHALAETSKNKVLLRLVNGIVDLLADSRERALQTGDRPKKSLTMHREILAAIKKGDARGAERAMRKHIEAVKGHILGLMKNSLSRERIISIRERRGEDG